MGNFSFSNRKNSVYIGQTDFFLQANRKISVY
jgi:hypothetical protein